ncbi:MAG: CRISPR-associated protein Cas5 [Syntrophobacteraceae bacterium]
MLCLYLQAPFAVFRTFTGGSFRPTAGFITPSAAYGLLLNAAGIEMRHFDNDSLMTLIKKDLPSVKLAIAALDWPNQHSIFQQLHNYPIGTSGKEHAPSAKGSKYNIVPVRREFLSNIKAYIRMDGNDELESWVLDGLTGRRPRDYGLLFLGDNNFLVDRFEPVTDPLPAYWFEKIAEGQNGLRDRITRLTLSIDRADLSRTRSALFAPIENKTLEPPQGAWVDVSYS